MLSIGIARVIVVNRVLNLRMSSTKFSYEEAVHKLNLLQSNKSTIDQIRKGIKNGEKCNNLKDMENYLSRTGVTMSMLDTLSVIHVAGTKGKGSTSAMCESILRSYGFRTGFYSSPHLVAVRERIQLEGQILSKEKFAYYFHQVYGSLLATQAFEGDMPKYFSFLTVLAFNVFLKEKVDVAIVEVGIGGIVDYTNVLRKVPVVGITPLGLDHTSILGNTLPEIAAAKAGIMKPGCEAYTVHQAPEAMAVLKKVAKDVKCSLNVVPELSSYKYENGLKLSIYLEAYAMNASLAIQLSHAWIRRIGGSIQPMVTRNVTCKKDDHLLVDILTKETVKGLKEFRWPGRYQTVKTDYAEFYLDGAHTKESMDICAKWFTDSNR
ncbi:unnamed protein product [Danaus chrysippus]|uniref:tetrahydrofolate synthase n=1 Tax=Danaus chrysippus TaxID=151541 RepID=A0A8J2QZZ9_9NEOP|nr:unnamed protein product [Danaus chrysippus]